MGFFDKLKSAIRKIKGKLTVFGILFLVILIWAIAPLSVALKDGWIQKPGEIEFSVIALFSPETFDWAVFLMQIGQGVTTPIDQLKKCFTDNYFEMFFDVTKASIAFFGIFVLWGIAQAFPKHEYQDIENGSSDWCEGGEQYKVLHKSKGIILAEKNYLPVDKRGNVNVLVVRRFWCW